MDIIYSWLEYDDVNRRLPKSYPDYMRTPGSAHKCTAFHRYVQQPTRRRTDVKISGLHRAGLAPATYRNRVCASKNTANCSHSFLGHLALPITHRSAAAQGQAETKSQLPSPSKQIPRPDLQRLGWEKQEKLQLWMSGYSPNVTILLAWPEIT